MIRHSALCLVLVFLCIPVEAFSQSRDTNSRQIDSATGKVHYVVGTYMSCNCGSGNGQYRLSVDGKPEEFWYDRHSRMDNTLQNPRAYDAGAEWRISYTYANFDGQIVPLIRTASFTGRVLSNRVSPRGRIKVTYYRNNSNSWSFLVGEGDSEISLVFNLSTDGIGNKPYYRIGQKYYEFEIRTGNGMTQFDGLLRNGSVVWYHLVRGRTAVADTKLVGMLNGVVSLGKRGIPIPNNSNSVIVADPSQSQIVLDLTSYSGLRRYIRRIE